jgi:hypothetical protein
LSENHAVCIGVLYVILPYLWDIIIIYLYFLMQKSMIFIPRFDREKMTLTNSHNPAQPPPGRLKRLEITGANLHIPGIFRPHQFYYEKKLLIL